MDNKRVDRITNEFKLEKRYSVVSRLAKPSILSLLENSCEDQTCLTIGQKLSAIELIVFVFNVLKKKFKCDSQPICVKHLYLLVKEFMSKQLVSISDLKCRQTMSNCEPNDSEDKQKLSFNNLLTDFIESKILSINGKQQTIGYCSDCVATYSCFQWISKVEQMLDNCLISVFQNYLMIQLEKYGGKRVDDIEMRLIRCHKYLFQYLFSEQSNYRLLDFTQSFPERFTIHYSPQNNGNSSQSDPYIEAYIGFRLSQHTFHGFECKTIYCLMGWVSLLDPNNRYIRLKEPMDLSPDFRFTINSKVIQIYGQKVVTEELIEWVHTNDLVVFDAQLITNNQNMVGLLPYSWFVTSISRVQHFAHCYIGGEHLFSNFQWHRHI